MIKRSYTLLSVLVLASMVISACGAGTPAASATPAPVAKTASADPLDNVFQKFIENNDVESIIISAYDNSGFVLANGNWMFRIDSEGVHPWGKKILWEEMTDIRIAEDDMVTAIADGHLLQMTADWMKSEKMDVAVKYLKGSAMEFVITDDQSVWWRKNNDTPWELLNKRATEFATRGDYLAVETSAELVLYNIATKPTLITSYPGGMHPQFWHTNETFFYASEHAIVEVNLESGNYEVQDLCATAFQTPSFSAYSWKLGFGGSMIFQDGGLHKCAVDPFVDQRDQIIATQLASIPDAKIVGTLTEINFDANPAYSWDILVVEDHGDFTAYSIDNLPEVIKETK